MPITININSGTDFEPVSEGVHAAVLADIVDLGVVDTSFGPKHKVRLVWLSDEVDTEGRTKYLFKRYTASLHEKATLRKDVKQILGKDIDGDSFDIETLIGRNNQLVIQHSEDANTGKVYANIIGIMKPATRLAIPPDFTRKKDKTDGPKPNGGQQRPSAVKAAGGGRAVAKAAYAGVPPGAQSYEGTAPITDDDIPF